MKAIDFDYWTPDEISEIARAGFPALGVRLPEDTVRQLAAQAFGSPQLMQSMCLQTCYQLNVEDTRDPPLVVPSFDANQMRRVLEHTATTTDFSTLLDAVHAGPKLRGQERSQFRFHDGSEGDVYRCVLLALAGEPPKLSLRYDEIYTRTRSVCFNSAPSGSSVNEALTQVHKIAEAVQPLSRVIEWSGDVLDIADPYFLFYLRCSSRLARIQRKSDGQGAFTI